MCLFSGGQKEYFEERFLYLPFRNAIPEENFNFLRDIGVFDKIWYVLEHCLCEVLWQESCKFVCAMFYDLWNE